MSSTSRMTLPLSVMKFGRSCGCPPSLTSSCAAKLRAIGITSTGSGKLPSTPTSFDWSTMHTNSSPPRRRSSRGQRAAAALDHRAVLGYFVGAVDVDRAACRWLVSSSTGMPWPFSRSAVLIELATAPLMRCLIFASSSMK